MKPQITRSQPPLPVRDGVNPTKLRVPLTGPWPTIAAYMIDRFDHLDPQQVLTRFDRAEVAVADGTRIPANTPLGDHEFIWYYRNVPDEEPPVAGELVVLFQDDDLVVVDKPHFLPTTPGGRFVQNSALVKLRRITNNPDLVPLHRLDRATAGVLLFSAKQQTRGIYQMLFENRAVHKTYEAVSALPAQPAGRPRPPGVEEHVHRWISRFPLVYRNRIMKTKGVITATVEPYPPADSGHLDQPRTGARRRLSTPTTGPNAETRITVLGWDASPELPRIHYHLEPRTGRTHQLRIHLAGLGTPILHDPFYPVLQEHGPDDVDKPLQLLARSIGFIDPVTRQSREFHSTQRLRFAPS